MKISQIITEQVLLEAAISRYMQMFQEFTALEGIDAPIKEAMQVLKKDDRIIWYLRIFKAHLINRSFKNDEEFTLSKFMKAFTRKYTEKLPPSAHLLETIKHYLDMNIPSIENFQFGWKPWSEIETFFKQEEEKYNESIDDDDRSLTEHGKSIMKFPDGFVWWDLEKSGCSDEAQAMGHCGNGAGQPGQTVLSLRRPDNRKNGQWIPHLTFILDTRTGSLGEMKGRNNDKPAKKYHPYIIALLKSNLIKKVVGGGYMPSHNFNLNDLTDLQIADLRETKPELIHPLFLWLREVITARKITKSDQNELLKAMNIDPTLSEFDVNNNPSISDWAYDNDNGRLDHVARDIEDDELEIPDEVEWDNIPESHKKIIIKSLFFATDVRTRNVLKQRYFDKHEIDTVDDLIDTIMMNPEAEFEVPDIITMIEDIYTNILRMGWEEEVISSVVEWFAHEPDLRLLDNVTAGERTPVTLTMDRSLFFDILYDRIIEEILIPDDEHNQDWENTIDEILASGDFAWLCNEIYRFVFNDHSEILPFYAMYSERQMYEQPTPKYKKYFEDALADDPDGRNLVATSLASKWSPWQSHK
jgi:hypothetical protein